MDCSEPPIARLYRTVTNPVRKPSYTPLAVPCRAVRAQALDIHIDFSLFHRLALTVPSGNSKIPCIKTRDIRTLRSWESCSIVVLNSGVAFPPTFLRTPIPHPAQLPLSQTQSSWRIGTRRSIMPTVLPKKAHCSPVVLLVNAHCMRTRDKNGKTD